MADPPSPSPPKKTEEDLSKTGPSGEDEDDEKELERLAMEALLQEAKRAKTRAEQVGAMGWQKCELPKANKRFLGNMVMGAVASNRKKQRLDPRDSPSRKQRRDGEHRREYSKEVKVQSGGPSRRKQSTERKRK